MKQFEINKAVNALFKLSNAQMPIRDAYNVFMLQQKLSNNYEFQHEQEVKLLNKYHCTIQNGKISFQDDGNAAKFKSEIEELLNIDVDLCIDPIHISLDSISNSTLTPNDIAALSRFVVFD